MKIDDTSFEFNVYIVLPEKDPRCVQLVEVFETAAASLRDLGFNVDGTHIPNVAPSVVH